MNAKDFNPSKPYIPASLNHYNGFSDFERSSDPVEAAAVEAASSVEVVCCNGQRAESRENSSGPANKSAFT